jgi:hypothetical protein
MSKSIADLHTSILEDHFFSHIDRGREAEETPLFSGKLHGEELTVAIAIEFDLPLSEAEALLDIAQQEVAL